VKDAFMIPLVAGGNSKSITAKNIVTYVVLEACEAPLQVLPCPDFPFDDITTCKNSKK
jgi:hypothetical protein